MFACGNRSSGTPQLAILSLHATATPCQSRWDRLPHPYKAYLNTRITPNYMDFIDGQKRYVLLTSRPLASRAQTGTRCNGIHKIFLDFQARAQNE